METKVAENIEAVMGKFVMVSASKFEAHGEIRTRYTVRKPNGSKHIHLIGYPTGAVRLC